MNSEEKVQDASSTPSSILATFKEFQLELDAKHDKHERIVKLSRDITIDSKRVIFQLQRIPGSTSETREKILQQVRQKLDEIINNKFFIIAEQLVNEDAYQFLRAYSPGLQEYIEGESLYHYLKDGSLVSHSSIQRLLDFTRTKDEGQVKVDEATDLSKKDALLQQSHQSDEAKTKISETDEIKSSPNTDKDSQAKEASSSSQDSTTKSVFVTIPLVEYILGICDLTGEIMRLAITHVSTGDLDRPFQLCNFLRDVYNVFTSFGYVNREFSKKLSVIQQSLVKVETACYNLKVRGSEVPKHMLVDMFASNQEPIHMDDAE